MKNFILKCAVTCVTTFACINQTYAQAAKPHLGIKAGADLMTLGAATSNGISLNYKHQVGLQAGIYADVPLASNVSFVPQLLFSQKGGSLDASFTVGNVTTTFKGNSKINYLDVPLLFSFKLQPKLSFFVGPQVAFFMSQKSTLITYQNFDGVVQSNNSSDGFKKTILGGNLGVGYYFLKNVGLNLNYLFDFQHTYTGANDTGEKNSGFALTVSYLF